MTRGRTVLAAASNPRKTGSTPVLVFSSSSDVADMEIRDAERWISSFRLHRGDCGFDSHRRLISTHTHVQGQGLRLT